jgi:capsular exopolysaccharide synthesis family protein
MATTSDKGGAMRADFQAHGAQAVAALDASHGRSVDGLSTRDASILANGRHEPWLELGYADLANAVRRICTLCGWTLASTSSGRTLAITSALEREGKSSLARAVAISMARDHTDSVLLLECDLLRPSLSEDFGINTSPGLSEVLVGEASLDEALRPTELPNLQVLPAGAPFSNPSRLLRSPDMPAIFDEVRDLFAFVIVDLPAVLRSSDAAVLARLADGVVMVVRAGVTDMRAVQQAHHLLAGTTFHGVVLNRWRSAVPDVVRRVMQM